LDSQPGVLISQLDAIADAEIDIEVGSMGDGLIAIEEGHVANVDFPIEMAGSARIIGVIGRSALGMCGKDGNQQEKKYADQTRHSDHARDFH